MKAGGVKSTPIKSTAIKSTPIKSTPGKSKPIKAAPKKAVSSKDAPPKTPSAKVKPAKIEANIYLLRLYVAGKTPKSLTAFVNLKKICDDHLAGQYQLEIIDLLENPTLAGGDQILAIPTLVRRLPAPVRKIIGDLSNTERVLIGLDILQREV